VFDPEDLEDGLGDRVEVGRPAVEGDPVEFDICDTDQRMKPNPGGFGITEGSGGSNPSVDGI
jgi:hypothetical protein